MRITELLVTGYDGDKIVFTSDLTPDGAETVLTSTDADGETIVEAVSTVRSRAFASLAGVLTELAASARISG